MGFIELYQNEVEEYKPPKREIQLNTHNSDSTLTQSSCSSCVVLYYKVLGWLDLGNENENERMRE